MLLLSITELSWSQQSCSQPLQTAGSVSIPSWRHRHPSLNLAGVLFSLPAKDKVQSQEAAAAQARLPLRQALAEPPQTPTEAVPQQAGLCHQPQAGLTQRWDCGETGHRVGRKQVLSLLGASQAHNSRHPASAMGKLPHKARCCHRHQNALTGGLPPWHRQGTWGEAPAWGYPRDGQAAPLGWTSHPKATGSDSQSPQSKTKPESRGMPRGPSQ